MIKDLALIFIVASIVTILFKKLNQPVVLGYIVAGFLISPNFTYLPTVIESEDIHVWANIGVVFLMYRDDCHGVDDPYWRRHWIFAGMGKNGLYFPWRHAFHVIHYDYLEGL